MIFRRTSNGLSNQHLFWGVDAIVFVEGGKGYSKEEVYQDKYGLDSVDIQFWRGLFSLFGQNKRFQFRAIGSKGTLKSIAKDIETGDIQNVYIAMDRNFNFVTKQINISKGVLYTHGYSWENDVWQPEVVEDVFHSVCVVDCSLVNVKKIVHNIYKQFLDQISIGVYADALLSIKSDSFFNRKKHLCYIVFGKKIQPTTNMKQLSEQLRDYSLTEPEAKKFGVKYKIIAQKDCYGHLIADFCYWLIVYLCNKFGKLPAIAKHYINCMGIEKFLSRLSNRKPADIYSYYENIFSLAD